MTSITGIWPMVTKYRGLKSVVFRARGERDLDMASLSHSFGAHAGT
jgi:hypothetical protein